MEVMPGFLQAMEKSARAVLLILQAAPISSQVGLEVAATVEVILGLFVATERVVSTIMNIPLSNLFCNLLFLIYPDVTLGYLRSCVCTVSSA